MKNKLPLIISLICLPFLLMAIRESVRLHLQAVEATRPRFLRITNLNDKSFSVSFLTQSPVDSELILLTEAEEKAILNTGDSVSRQIHYFILTGLEPETEYQFYLVNQGREYRPSLTSYYRQTTLGSSQTPPLPPQNIYGRVLDKVGQPQPNALLYLTSLQGTPLSLISDLNGHFLFDLNQQRQAENDSHFSLTAINRSLQTGAVTLPRQELNQVIELKLGENLDLTVLYPYEEEVLQELQPVFEGVAPTGGSVEIRVE